MQNYFNYFTEIEEHYLRRRGTGLLLSTLDWALIETWKDSGIPLPAVLRGIDATFDRYDQRPGRKRRINGLAYCSQEVLAAAEDAKEAAVGTARERGEGGEAPFEAQAVVAFLRGCAEALVKAVLPERAGISPRPLAQETAATLRGLAAGIESTGLPPRMEDLERHLTVLEERLYAMLLAAAPDEEMLRVREQADRDIAPYRSKMPAAQVEQLQKQYVRKRMLEVRGLPRFSLFYM